MKKIIITSGGTSEKIDNVRKITNSSSGKLGMLIANHLLEENDDIFIYYIFYHIRAENARELKGRFWVMVGKFWFSLRTVQDDFTSTS